MKFIITPKFLVIYQIILLLVAIFFPKDIYEYYVGENDYMFFNVYLLMVGILMIVFFYIGLIFGKIFFNIISTSNNKENFININKKPVYFVLFPLISMMILVMLYIIIFIKQNHQFFNLYVFGTVYKQSIKANLFYYSTYMLIGVILWSIIKSDYIRNHKIKKILKRLIILGIFEVLIVSLLMQARFILMPFLIALFMIFIYKKHNINFKYLLIFIFLFLFILLITAYFRSSNNEDVVFSIIKQLIGYTIASYNRFALIIEGELHYTYSYTYYYLFPALNYIPLLHNVFSNFYGVSDSIIWNSEFISVWNSGLEGYYIWSTLYGYIFDSIGWFSLIYLFFLGFLTQFFFELFKRKSTIGIVFYSLIYASFILVFVGNIFFLSQFIAYLYVVILLILWESLFKIKKKSNFYECSNRL